MNRKILRKIIQKIIQKIIIQEAIPLSMSKKYTNGWNKNRYNDWFEGKYRIYLPL